ncbi:MAG: Fic family protein [Lachnospiraceae bacterium]|nr:Fic family protein [Lachnospiraceae bacterium]
MNKPPFEINDNMINLVAEINKKIGYLEASLDRKKDLYLRKASKIKSVNSSCAIEANPLTEKEVESIINGKRVIALPEEIIEVKNAYEAYLQISTYKPYDVKSFLIAHKQLMTDLIRDSGKFRAGDVAVYEDGIPIHIGARPEFVHDLVADLFGWANSSNLNSLIKACVVHYEIETIHPFSDGNGRIGRLWQSVILYHYNPLFELIPIETLVYENQKEYYGAIESSRKINDSAPFIEYMLEMISKTIDSFHVSIKAIIQIKDEYLKGLTKNDKEILQVIVHSYTIEDYITAENLSTKINKSLSSIRVYFRKLTENRLLIATGVNKGRKYRINEEILQ